MKLGSVSDRTPVVRTRPARGLAPWFYAVWTAVVVLVVWWLGAGNPDRADLLIAVDRSDADSGLTSVRAWVNTHVEVYWVYPWILLAPYVVGLGLRVAIEKDGLAWQLALHLAIGAGFVSVSQALTHRLEAMRPKAVFLKEERVVRRVTKDGTNVSTNVALSWKIEWHGHAGKSGTNGSAGDPISSAATSNIPEWTNSPSSGATEQTEVLVLRTERDPLAAATPPPSNRVFDSARSNETASSLGSRLAPLIEEEMKALRGHQAMAAPRMLTAALDGLAYLALMGLTQALHFRRRLSERENQAALLESKLTQSRLHALQAQLQPHFLFNALNGIATLVRRDPRVAEEMLTSLSDLLRVSLAHTGRQEIPLREELDFLERYLELQQMRFGDRLRVERSIDAEAFDCLVPSLLFQPLVENAIRHGIEPSPNPGIVRIRAELRDRQVVLSVEDNGCGLHGQKGPTTPGNGIGLTSVRERLAGLYGERQEFTLQEQPGGGVSVRIKIPARLATEVTGEPGTGKEP